MALRACQILVKCGDSPVPGVDVEVWNEDASLLVIRGETNASGLFCSPAGSAAVLTLDDGSYIVRASKVGYAVPVTDLEVSDDTSATITATASSSPILSRVKDHLGIARSDTSQDDDLSTLIATAWAWFEQQTGRALGLATYTSEPYDGDGGTTLLPLQFPVVSVSSVYVDGALIPQAASATDQGWILRDTMIRLRGYRFNVGIDNVEITYSAGYATMPEDINHAIIELVGFWYRGREHIGLTSHSIEGASVAYSTYSAPSNVFLTVDAYRRRD